MQPPAAANGPAEHGDYLFRAIDGRLTLTFMCMVNLSRNIIDTVIKTVNWVIESEDDISLTFHDTLSHLSS